jgi:methylated-DNA-[protein]-cysteine S-methyltransferase
MHLSQTETPIGTLTLAARDRAVCLLHFGGDGPAVRSWLARWYPGAVPTPHDDPGGAIGALRRYFEGDLDALDHVPVELNGTPFQKRVWTALRGIRAGRTASYAEIARGIHEPTAIRAVGAANGANPIALIVPCHRVIGSSGSLTGYGGGLERKRWLLMHERALGVLEFQRT